MPAIPVMQPKHRQPLALAEALGRQGIFERGDHIYLQTPVQIFRPSTDQIEEFAFSKAVKQNAPNENLVWLKGQYVEADNANANGAQWAAEELSIKSLTPMLMPVTVMHDPRTAVGTIADVKMLTPEKDGVPRARIDTVLALWGHRFPEAVHEAEANAAAGTLMQSMECYSPWYECSECGAVFHKLPGGAEQAQWCDHLRASNPSAGFVDLSAANGSAQTPNASRILGDVCFTGTGLIFGTRGAQGAYSEAFLSNFEDEVAAFHHSVHNSTATTTSEERAMGLVQIEQSELDTLRKERDDARAERDTEKAAKEQAVAEKAAAESAAEAAEAAKVAAETAKTTAETELASKNEELAKAELKETRLGALGEGFKAKVAAMPTLNAKLTEQAQSLSDEDWEARLTEVEEVTAIKRDAKKDGTTEVPDPAAAAAGQTFGREELASITGLGGDAAVPATAERSAVVGSLASAFRPTPAKTS
jgi:hypothetical protein